MAAKNTSKTFKEKNLAELGTETATKASRALVSELSEDWKISMRQMLGMNEDIRRHAQVVEGDLKEGEEISFSKQKEHAVHVEPAIDYRAEVLHAERNNLQKENAQLRGRLDEIYAELKKIEKASKEIETEFRGISRETMQQTVNPGKYHVNFFEWMLLTIQNARVRIESAATWVNAISSKRAKKDYWSLSKKHGTSYSLSSERVVAQQVG